jgi:hypothetical protein
MHTVSWKRELQQNDDGAANKAEAARAPRARCRGVSTAQCLGGGLGRRQVVVVVDGAAP